MCKEGCVQCACNVGDTGHKAYQEGQKSALRQTLVCGPAGGLGHLDET